VLDLSYNHLGGNENGNEDTTWLVLADYITTRHNERKQQEKANVKSLYKQLELVNLSSSTATRFDTSEETTNTGIKVLNEAAKNTATIIDWGNQEEEEEEEDEEEDEEEMDDEEDD